MNLRKLFRPLLRQWYKIFNYGALIDHAAYGKFRVKYKDGAISHKFSYRTAKDYAEIFGGEVIDAF